jgi:hypothetical protein
MSPAFELILHHTYAGWDGLPVDLSDHDSHGQAIDADVLKDGLAPGSGALRLAQPQSRVSIPMSPASPWQTLGGVKVEVTARLLRFAAHWQTLIAADQAFNFFLRERHVIAEFPTPAGKSTLTWAFSGPNHDGISTAEHGSVPPNYVRPGRWITFGFFHDGLDTLDLFLDGELAARRTGLLVGIPGAGPFGVGIGNAPGNAGLSLEGDIDEVKVWRLNPHIMDQQFFSRPVDDGVAQCWQRFFRSLGKALEHHSDCARQVDGAISTALDRLRRAILAKGPETRERYIKTSQEYLQLWRAGKLDGPEMAKLITDWCTWLRLVGISFEDDLALRGVLQSDCLKLILAECEPFDCDQQAQALVRLIAQNCHHGVGT